MTETTLNNGRLGNQIIKNIAVNFIAKKHNLYVKYANQSIIEKLGINLFSGNKIYQNTNKLTDENFFKILNIDEINYNINANDDYFQTKEISNFIYNWLNSEIKNNIIKKNPFHERYNKNNDVFIHVRLGDATQWNPGVNYYLKAIKKIFSSSVVEKIFLSTDTPNHGIIEFLKKQYKIDLFNQEEINTIQFGSTCKNVILSHGSFSAIIGWLSFYSNVYYCEYEKTKIWYGDMFTIDNWIKLP